MPPPRRDEPRHSPDFVMPRTLPGQRAAPVPTGVVRRRERTASAARDDDPEPPRAPWRQLVIACLLGVVIGAAPPAALQAADRTAAEERVDGLRSTALAYLSAIAAGDAERATAMVPVSGHAAPDAVLRSADPIADAAVRLVMVDGAAGAVEVG